MRFFSTSYSNGSSHPRNGLIDFLIGALRPTITIVDPLIPSSLLRVNEREQSRASSIIRKLEIALHPRRLTSFT